MKLSSLLAIAGGAVGLANSSDWASALSSGAAVVSGVAGATGNSNLAKIAGIAALGAGAYSAFGGDSPTINQSPDIATGNTPPTSSIDTALSSSMPGGPSGTGQSFSDAKFDATGTDQPASQPSTAFSDALNTPSSDGFGATGVPTTSPIDTAAINGGIPSASSPTGTIAPATTNPDGSLLDKFTSGVGQLGNWVDKNKELVKLGAGALEGMYGPGAQQMSLLKQRLAMQQQEIDRRNANANNLTGLTIPVNANAVPLRRG